MILMLNLLWLPKHCTWMLLISLLESFNKITAPCHKLQIHSIIWNCLWRSMGKNGIWWSKKALRNLLKSIRNLPNPCLWYWGMIIMQETLYFCWQSFSWGKEKQIKYVRALLKLAIYCTCHCPCLKLCTHAHSRTHTQRYSYYNLSCCEN